MSLTFYLNILSIYIRKLEEWIVTLRIGLHADVGQIDKFQLV